MSIFTVQKMRPIDPRSSQEFESIGFNTRILSSDYDIRRYEKVIYINLLKNSLPFMGSIGIIYFYPHKMYVQKFRSRDVMRTRKFGVINPRTIPLSDMMDMQYRLFANYDGFGFSLSGQQEDISWAQVYKDSNNRMRFKSLLYDDLMYTDPIKTDIDLVLREANIKEMIKDDIMQKISKEMFNPDLSIQISDNADPDMIYPERRFI